MDNGEITAKLKELDEKVSLVYTSVEKTRKYFLAIIWISVIALVLPALGLMFVIPTFIEQYTSVLGGI